MSEFLPARKWLRLWPGMQDEAVMLTDAEVIANLKLEPEEAAQLLRAKVGDWVCDSDGYYIRLNIGPLFGTYLIPR